MTGPALNLIGYIFEQKLELIETIEENKYRILISFGNNEKVNPYFA
jgi:hypothetical protein